MPLKIGIVGMGGIGKQHGGCYKADPLADLVAVCDIVKEKADAAAELFGVKAYYSLREMLNAHPELDIVDVTTSGYENGSWHYEPAVEAIEAGKHVLVEKPISNDIQEARDLVELARIKDVYLGCNLNHYFTLTAGKAWEYINGGQVGEPVYLMQKMGFHGSEGTYKKMATPRWQQSYSHVKAFLAHPFSIMRHFGGNITHIQAFLTKTGIRRTNQDLMLSINSINMQFENGSVGYILSQRGDAHFGLGGWWSFEMAGTKGTFCIENCVEKLTYWTMGQEPETYNTGLTEFGETFAPRLHAFLEDVSSGMSKQYIRASGYDALATLEYTFAVIESYENGGALVRPHPLPLRHGDPSVMV